MCVPKEQKEVTKMNRKEIIAEVKKNMNKYDDHYNAECMEILGEQIAKFKEEPSAEHNIKVINALKLCMLFDGAVYVGADYSRLEDNGEYGFRGYTLLPKGSYCKSL